uniref:Uncharacterized protein n=1 Tax=Oryza barthii TaxID=65489 RepID=A0A0D3EKN3_9ORYZ
MAAENTNTSAAHSVALPIPPARPPLLAIVARPHPPQDAVHARDGVHRIDPKTPEKDGDVDEEHRLALILSHRCLEEQPGWVAVEHELVDGEHLPLLLDDDRHCWRRQAGHLAVVEGAEGGQGRRPSEEHATAGHLAAGNFSLELLLQRCMAGMAGVGLPKCEGVDQSFG